MSPYAVKLATRHLLSHPGQTALLMSGVALGVGVFIFMSALIGGLATLLTLRTVGSIPHVVLEMPDRDPAVLAPQSGAQVVLQRISAGGSRSPSGNPRFRSSRRWTG